MDTTKIQSALEDLRKQRARIMQQLNSLQTAIAGLEDVLKRVGDFSPGESPGSISAPAATAGGYVDLAVEYLESIRRPATIMGIVEYIRKVRNNPNLHRKTVEATISRHTQGNGGRIIRVGRGLIGLPLHAQQSLTLPDKSEVEAVA